MSTVHVTHTTTTTSTNNINNNNDDHVECSNGTSDRGNGNLDNVDIDDVIIDGVDDVDDADDLRCMVGAVSGDALRKTNNPSAVIATAALLGGALGAGCRHQPHHHRHQQDNKIPTTGGGGVGSSSAFLFDSLLVSLPIDVQSMWLPKESTNEQITQQGGDVTYHFKVLVPSVAAGAIIGKGGETIAQLQKDTGGRIKMSKSHDFYPGTTERVCLITGNVEAIMSVMDFIMDKIREKPDLSKPPLAEGDGKLPQDRDKQVKILVPNSTAGMIIGKAGSYIKQIKEASGSYVQISQKAKDASLQERCITVIGEKEPNKKACLMILAKIVDDPQSGSCLNVSYADVSGPVANYNPTGSPFAQQNAVNAFNASTASLNSGLGSVSQGLMLNGGVSLSLNLNASGQNVGAITSNILENIKIQLRTTGYSDAQVAEICAAMSVLSKYGILAMGLGLSGPHAALPNYLSFADQSAAAGGGANAGVFGPIGQVSIGDCLGTTSPTPRSALERYDSAFDPFRHQSSPATAPISINNNSFGLGTGQHMAVLSKSPTPGELGNNKDSKNVEIAEVIVGAILGPGGRSLVEIQQMSGANIQISKKGIFAPGTRNRIVTITGSPNSINTAQYLIEQRISEEELKRARTNAIGPLTM